MNTDSLQALEQELGYKSTYDLLVFSLPILRDRKARLFEALAAQHWEQAAQIAHQVCGSVRMYGSARSETLLRVIAERHVELVKELGFQQELETELRQVLINIEDWLEASREVVDSVC